MHVIDTLLLLEELPIKSSITVIGRLIFKTKIQKLLILSCGLKLRLLWKWTVFIDSPILESRLSHKDNSMSCNRQKTQK